MTMMKKRKELIGQVVKDKMNKTIVVQIRRTIQHPMYGKLIREQTKLKVHDENNECRAGDKVRLVECRPLSKEKHWRVVEVVARAKRLETVPDKEGP